MAPDPNPTDLQHNGCSSSAPTLLDEFLPTYDVSDAVATTVSADAETTWNALMDLDLIDVGRQRPAVAVLSTLRALPELLDRLFYEASLPDKPTRLRLRDLTSIPLGEGGWVLLGERHANEIALGLVGKFWRPIITFAKVSARDFRGFAEPGYAKTIYSLSVRALEPHRTLLAGVMRTATTDEQSRRWFRRYWTFGVGSGAHVVVQAVMDIVRETAERGCATNPRTTGGAHGTDHVRAV
jgi:hypothetical protein